MNLVDRFTRDRVSRVIWGVCLVFAIGLLVLAVIRGRTATDDQRAASEARAGGYATTIIQPSIEGSSLEQPISEGVLEQLTLAVKGGILIDRRVTAVRLWAPDGSLLYSTIPEDELGGEMALNDPQIQRALSEASPVTISERSSAEDPEQTPELISYVPIVSTAGAEAVVEIVQDIDAAIGDVQGDWLRLQLLAGALATAFLVLTILSFRPPFAKIGAGTGFVAEAVPPGYAVIEEERLRAVNDVYALAQERVDRLKERLRMSEHARLESEGELQRVLSRFESPKQQRSRPSMSVLMKPEPDREPELETGRVRTTTNEPEPTLEPESPMDTVEETQAVAQPEPEARLEPEPEPDLEPEPDSEPEPGPESVVIPEPQVAPASERAWVSTLPEIVELNDDDEDDAEIARELLLRLMETEVPMADTGVDPGEVRAKLARTAARKKPGGGERRLVEDESSRPSPPWARTR